MAQNDTFKRYLDAGMAFTQLTRERAEEFVKDLVKAGEVRRKETEEVIESLLERSRTNTEELVGLIRREIADQLRNLGLEDAAKRAGLPDKTVDAAEKLDDAAGDMAEQIDRPDPKAASATTKTATSPKTSAPKKAPAAKKTPATETPLVIPGAPKKTPAKKLIVPPSAGAEGAAATTKAAPTKKAAPKKSGSKKP